MQYCHSESCHASRARLSCAACRVVFYCDATCQRDDWRDGGHKLACKAIAKAVASLPAAPPLLFGNDASSTCGWCGDAGAMQLCGLCQAVRYCAVPCQRDAWADGHKKACAVLSALFFTRQLAEAKAGDVDVQYLVGHCYKEGTGVAADACEAVRWFTRAAEAGDADAQYRLGLCYEKGIGMPVDAREAVR